MLDDKKPLIEYHLFDTHCHMNMMVKKEFDTLMSPLEISSCASIIAQAQTEDTSYILNVGTSVPESANCVALAYQFPYVWAAVGIHPNDCTSTWLQDMQEIKNMIKKDQQREGHLEPKIKAIGECGIDKHYPDYNLSRQYDAFRAQIELALTYDLAVVVHSRDAYDETLKIIDEYRHEKLRGTIHCFSEDLDFARHAISCGFVLGIGGTITYPKNTVLRDVVTQVGLEHIILETDAPFLPPQIIRGKQNHPQYIKHIALYLANLYSIDYQQIARITTNNAQRIFKI